MGCVCSSQRISASTIPDQVSAPSSCGESDGEDETRNESTDFGQIGEYKIFQQIGRGISGFVYMAQSAETGKKYAAKIYNKVFLAKKEFGRPGRGEKLRNELELLSQINHPNCINVVDVVDDSVKGVIVLIMPLALRPLMQNAWSTDPISEDEARHIFRQVGEAIQYIHSLDIIHRDIKPENVLLFENGKAVLNDFSVSIKLSSPDELVEDSDGTPIYSSPEENSGDKFDGKAADVWSFGVSLYVMIFGKLPFSNHSNEGTFFEQCAQISKHIIEDPISFEKTPAISSDLLELFSHVLDKQPNTRYTIVQALDHRWFASSHT